MIRARNLIIPQRYDPFLGRQLVETTEGILAVLTRRQWRRDRCWPLSVVHRAHGIAAWVHSSSGRPFWKTPQLIGQYFVLAITLGTAFFCFKIKDGPNEVIGCGNSAPGIRIDSSNIGCEEISFRKEGVFWFFLDLWDCEVRWELVKFRPAGGFFLPSFSSIWS